MMHIITFVVAASSEAMNVEGNSIHIHPSSIHDDSPSLYHLVSGGPRQDGWEGLRLDGITRSEL